MMRPFIVLMCLSAYCCAEEQSSPLWAIGEAHSDAPMETLKNVRIVDYGDDYVYHGAGSFRGAHKRHTEYGLNIIKDVDVNDDGIAAGDCISYMKYSLDEPLSIEQPHWDPEGNNSVFYGGITGYFANNKNLGGFTELKVNSFETPDGDNITMMVHGTKEWSRVYGLWLWKKEDFYSSGDVNRVSLDESSWMGIHCMRGWVGMDQARFVIREGEQFYISEYSFGSKEAQKAYEGQKQGLVYSIRPTETRWALYTPQEPYHIEFDSEAAIYKKREFTNVEVAGYYIAQHEGKVATVDAKMYAFELFGTVHRLERGSESLAMVPIPEQESVPSYYISRTEVPYALWRKVRRWAISQQWGREGYEPYLTGKDGDMGSMDYAGADGLVAHTSDEPVTDILWLDAVVWCNMLSEYEGRTPVYYYDEAQTIVLRRVFERRGKGNSRMGLVQQKAYVKWGADGYRLPTISEWCAVDDQHNVMETDAWHEESSEGRSHPVASKKPNTQGLYDMRGNVWEYVWDVDGPFIQEFIAGNVVARYKKPHVVVGGSYNTAAADGGRVYTSSEMKQASRYGDHPFSGSHEIGFRLVRRKPGLVEPNRIAKEAVPNTIPQWSIEYQDKGPVGEVRDSQKSILNLVDVPEGNYKRCDLARVFVSPFKIAETEVTYAQWKEVYDWAIRRGYVFNKDGDMGSMDRESEGKTYGPDEPVTDINRLDAIVFCNALSEMEGKTPVYRRGDKVFRSSPIARNHWVKQPKNNNYFENTPENEEWNEMVNRYGDSYGMPGSFQANWSADGYRLPTKSEWHVAYKGTSATQYYWGQEFDFSGDYSWTAHSSGGKTQAVAQKKPNSLGLYDMAGNVWEYCNGSSSVSQNQAFHETWNPKGGKIGRSIGIFGQIQGGSFELSARHLRSFRPLAKGRLDRWVHTPLMKGYPTIGFRPVRCKARTHRAGGSEMPEKIQVLDINLQEPITPLQGATHRGNLQRTGVLYGKSIVRVPQERWQFTTEGAIRGQPIVYRGVAYIFSEDGNLYAIDSQSGTEKWRFKTHGGPMSKEDRDVRPPAPTIKEGMLYLGDNAGYVYAIDTETGRSKWETTARGARRATGSPVPVYGAVFSFVNSHINGEGGIMAIHGETGQLLNIYKNQPWGPYQTWAFAEGNLLMSNHVAGSRIDLKSGSKSFYGSSSWHSNYNVPVVYDGNIYLIGLALGKADYRSGKPRYHLPIIGDKINVYGGSIEQRAGMSDNTLAVWQDKAYFGSRNGHLYCRATEDGSRIWEQNLGIRIRCAPIICSDVSQSQEAVVYCAHGDGGIFAHNANTGALLWSYDLGAEVEADLWTADGRLFVADMQGVLHALE